MVADADAEEGTTAVTTAEGDIEVETKVKAPKLRLPKANNRLTIRLLAAARHALGHPESGARPRSVSSEVLHFVVSILEHDIPWMQLSLLVRSKRMHTIYRPLGASELRSFNTGVLTKRVLHQARQRIRAGRLFRAVPCSWTLRLA